MYSNTLLLFLLDVWNFLIVIKNFPSAFLWWMCFACSRTSPDPVYVCVSLQECVWAEVDAAVGLWGCVKSPSVLDLCSFLGAALWAFVQGKMKVCLSFLAVSSGETDMTYGIDFHHSFSQAIQNKHALMDPAISVITFTSHRVRFN